MAASEDDMAGANPLEARPTDEIKANLDHPDVVRVLGPDAVALLKKLLEAKNDMEYAEVAKPMADTHTKAAAAAEISAPAIKLSTEEKRNIDLFNTEKEGLRKELRDFFQ